MLKIFRSALEGPLKWVFVALIIAAFGVFGVPSLDNFGNTSALTIEGKRISALDVQREVASQMRQIQAENPGISQEQAMAAGLGQQVVNVLTVRALIEAEADRLGVTAPDTVIRRYIEQLPDLQNPETGNFDPQRLGLVLQQLRLSTRGFGDLIGGELVRQQIVDALSSGGTVSDELTRYLLLRQFEERDIRFTTLTLDNANAEPSDEDIAVYYEENIANYQSPEYRVFSVVTITEADVADEITVSEEDIRRLFDVRVGAVEASETRSVNQFRVSGDAVTEVEELLAQGQTFAAVAEAVGAQVSTLADQQQTDFIAEAFGEAVFAAESGAIIGPVDTPFGALFGEVVAINRAEGPVFEDEREALEAELRSEIAEDLLVELVDRFEIARDEGASIAEAADQVGLVARTTQPADAELFTRFGSIANIPRTLAQEGQGLTLGEESDAIRLPDGYGFVGVDEIILPAPLPLSEVRTDIVTVMKAEAASNAADALEAQLDALIAEGRSFDDAVTALGGEPKFATVTVNDEERPLPDNVMAEVFRLDVGAKTVVPKGTQGEVDVVQVANVRFGDSSAVEQVLPLVSQQFSTQLSGELSEAYLEALQETSKITQNERQLARGLGQDQP